MLTLYVKGSSLMPGTLEEKQKAVRDMEELHGRIERGKEDFQKYSQMAEKMRSSCLEANVLTQLGETEAKLNALLHFADTVSQKIGSVHEQHAEFEANVGLARQWMERAWQTIRSNSSSEGKSREDLHEQLDTIRDGLHMISAKGWGEGSEMEKPD